MGMEKEAQNDAYDYMYAAIRTADWISSEYKELAEKYRKNTAIKELYMCICDNVNIDLLELVTIDEDTSDVLLQCRKKHLESDFTRKYQEAIDRITVITKSTEHEIKSLSGTVKQIAETIPIKEETFYVPEEDNVPADRTVVSESGSNEDEVQTFGKKELAAEKEKDMNLNAMEHMENTVNRNWLDKVKCSISRLFMKCKKTPKMTVMDMLAQGYSNEKITFILTCMNEGFTEREIKEIADPALSLENMELLKKIKLKERKKNGYR